MKRKIGGVLAIAVLLVAAISSVAVQPVAADPWFPTKTVTECHSSTYCGCVDSDTFYCVWPTDTEGDIHYQQVDRCWYHGNQVCITYKMSSIIPDFGAMLKDLRALMSIISDFEAILKDLRGLLPW